MTREERCRRARELRDEGLSVADIAFVMRRSVASVYTYLNGSTYRKGYRVSRARRDDETAALARAAMPLLREPGADGELILSYIVFPSDEILDAVRGAEMAEAA